MKRAVFYIDGRPAYEIKTEREVVPNELTLFVGSSNLIDQEGKPCAFVGKIDEVKIWSVARAEQNIRRDMRKVPNPRNRHLVAYFGFNGAPSQEYLNPTKRTGSLVLGSTLSKEPVDPVLCEGVRLGR